MFVGKTFKRPRAHLFLVSKMVSSIDIFLYT